MDEKTTINASISRQVGQLNFFDVSSFLGLYSAQDPAADFTGDGLFNFFDVSAFLSAFTSQDPRADLTNDGSWNFFDVSDFLGHYADGCP